MRSKLIAATAAIGLLSFPALAGDDHYDTRIVLMAGQIWNGNDMMTVSYFHDKTACESAGSAFEIAGKQAIATARPGSSFHPAFWYICAQVNSAMP